MHGDIDEDADGDDEVPWWPNSVRRALWRVGLGVALDAVISAAALPTHWAGCGWPSRAF